MGGLRELKGTIFSSKAPAMARITGAAADGISVTRFPIHRNLLLTTHVNLPSVAAAESSEIRLQNGVAATLVPQVVSVRGDMSVKGQKAEVGVNDMEGSVGFSDSKDFGFVGNESHSEGMGDEEIPGFNLNSAGLLGRPQDVSLDSSDPVDRTVNHYSSAFAVCLTLECFLYSNWDTESDQEFEGYQTGNLEPLGSGHIGITLDDTIKACERFQRLGVEFSKKQLCISHGDYLRLEHANIF
ncbi:hypothetical protein PVK06_019671 [Gossypium arboreum]|uniref:Uncharacterized protein n=1 Tax=Gossypium arboreum TaxID=29729 RepID=A0ABR0PKC8_GOSAR|nr:hypothetical protein PVK06_019671 [Gossypium arboreum]